MFGEDAGEEFAVEGCVSPLIVQGLCRLNDGRRRWDGWLNDRRSGGEGVGQGKDVDVEGLAVGQCDGALAEVFQLTDVAGPSVTVHPSPDGGGHFQGFSAFAAAVHVDEIAGEEGHVFGAFAERGNADGYDVEAVKEVLAKLAIGDHLGEILIGGGDEAYVEFNRRSAANGADFFFL